MLQFIIYHLSNEPLKGDDIWNDTKYDEDIKELQEKTIEEMEA